MFKKCKKFFSNKPWRDVTTRKLSFMYVLVTGTNVIVFGALLLILDKSLDSGVWLTETFAFLKWMLTTGVVIVLLSNVTDLIKFLCGVVPENAKEEQ